MKLSVDEAIKLLLINASNPSIMRWCGGWDLNPRRPTPSGPQPDPFDLARAPPRTPRQYAAKQVLKPYASPSFILCLAPGAGFEPARPAGGSGSPGCFSRKLVSSPPPWSARPPRRLSQCFLCVAGYIGLLPRYIGMYTGLLSLATLSSFSNAFLMGLGSENRPVWVVPS